MSLQTCGHHLYEPLLGIVLFEMREDGDLVHCMVSECALRNRARVDGAAEDGVEAPVPTVQNGGREDRLSAIRLRVQEPRGACT
jgi:hypothetical protein